MELQLLSILEKRFQFRANLIDGHQQWGMQVNGTWTGVVGQVYNGVNYTYSAHCTAKPKFL